MAISQPALLQLSYDLLLWGPEYLTVPRKGFLMSTLRRFRTEINGFLASGLAIFAFAFLAGSPSVAQEDNQPPAGFSALFNGKDLSGWHGMPHQNPYKLAKFSQKEKDVFFTKHAKSVAQHWKVEDGQIINDGHGAFLTTDKKYSNFEFFVDYKTVAKADSGIYLKASPQVQIWDTTKEGGKWNIGADKGSGGLWNNSKGAKGKDPLVLADKPFGEWNRVRVIQVGQRTSVWLNGKLVVDHAIMENFWNRKLPLPRDGVIQLQTHGGEIRWKNVFVRELSVDQSIAYLKDSDTEKFESIFDGKTLKGWKGATDNYEVVDGAIVCKKGHGGTLFTEGVYGDFQIQFQFNLPPGGNNGLAIRYPGKGDAAYGAMCELQVLDNNAKKYAKLDKRQYHGSAYGMVAARRGYLNKPGQWNIQKVTVKGSKIKVELNGSIILDADLSEVKKFMADRPHPGKDLKEGHFGFAGHNDPVRFRAVEIRRLK